MQRTLWYNSGMSDAALTPAPKRRWFRWSLRTMFVVVTVCGWIGYQLNWIRQRHEFIEAEVDPNCWTVLGLG